MNSITVRSKVQSLLTRGEVQEAVAHLQEFYTDNRVLLNDLKEEEVNLFLEKRQVNPLVLEFLVKKIIEKSDKDGYNYFI